MRHLLRKVGSLAIIAASGLVMAACGTIGSGDMVTEDRTVDPFDSLDISAGINVELTVDRGAARSVTVTVDDNLLDKLVTEVRGDTLHIKYEGAVSIVGSGQIVSVVVDTIENIDISGGADLEGSGNVAGYSLSASGGADVDLADLTAEDVAVDISGGADARIFASGSVEGEASGGADLTVLGDPAQSRIDTSGGADVDYEG